MHIVHNVLFLCRHADDALAAALLCNVGIGGLTFDIAGAGHRDNAGVAFDEVFQYDLVFRRDDLGSALIGVFALDFQHLILDDPVDTPFIGQNFAQFLDERFFFFQLIHDLDAFQSCQFTERHIDDRLRLHVSKAEAFHQCCLRIGDGLVGTDDADDLVDVLDGDHLTLENVSAGKCPIKVELHAAFDDGLLVRDIVVQNFRQGKALRLSVDKRDHIDGKRILQLGVFIELIEDDLTVGIAAVVDDNLHTGAAGFVSDVRDTLDTLFLDKICHTLNKHRLVHSIRNFRDEDSVMLLIDLRLGAHHDTTLTSGVRFDDALRAVNGRVGREVRALDILHDVGNACIGILHIINGTVDDLAEIVRGNIGRHTYRDTDRAVDKGRTSGSFSLLSKFGENGTTSFSMFSSISLAIFAILASV